jgi:hypothetical protein
MNKVSFSTFDPVLHDSPVLCDICVTVPPVFVYELKPADGDGTAVTGYCCGLCAPGFLRRLEAREAAEWAAEEAALEDTDILDTVDSPA